MKDALAAVDGAAVQRALDATVAYDLALVDGSSVRLDADDVEVRAESHEELALAQDGRYAVALDTTVDDELRAEGIARELIRRAQRPAQGHGLRDRRPRPRAPGRDRSGRGRRPPAPRLDRAARCWPSTLAVGAGRSPTA